MEARTGARAEVSTPDQRRAQAHLIRSVLMGSLAKDIVTGPFLVAFAVQVLAMSNGEVSAMLALLPLVVVLRYPFLDRIRAMPRQRVTLAARAVQLACLVLLLALPAAWLTFPALVAIAMLFVFGNEFLQNAVWLSFVAEVTGRGDRGRFLGRLRTAKQATALAFALFGVVLVGEALDREEHRILVVVVIALLANSAFWISRVPAAPPPADVARFSGRGGFARTLRTSPLLRRPLALALVAGVLNLPVLNVYLVGTLHMPANLLMLNVAAAMIGPIFSVFLWGRQADALGERRIFLIYFAGALALFPLLLLVPDFAAVEAGGRAWTLGVAALLAFHFAQGILDAGQLMAASMLQARHLGRADGFHALNTLTMIAQLSGAALTALGGLVLVATDAGGAARAVGPLWVDGFRVAVIAAAGAAIAVGVLAARGIPDD